MIVQLPDRYNTTNDIYNLIKEKCISVCPMCGENKRRWDYLSDGENNKGIFCWGNRPGMAKEIRINMVCFGWAIHSNTSIIGKLTRVLVYRVAADG